MSLRYTSITVTCHLRQSLKDEWFQSLVKTIITSIYRGKNQSKMNQSRIPLIWHPHDQAGARFSDIPDYQKVNPVITGNF
jgi:hypothetical protein